MTSLFAKHRQYELRERAPRFCEIRVEGKEIHLFFGVIGGPPPHERRQSFSSVAKCRAAVATKRDEKIEEGYVAAAENRLEWRPAGPSFWEMWIEGKRLHARFGPLGSSGTERVTAHPSAARCEEAAWDAHNEKSSEGFVEADAVDVPKMIRSMGKQLGKVLSTMTSREEEILRKRFGIAPPKAKKAPKRR